MRMRAHTTMGVCLPLLALCCVGCGPAETPRHPVTGRVLFRNQPLAEATVVFHPVDLTASRAPFAITDATGAFQFTYRNPGDGIPSGSYRVTIVRHKAVNDGDEVVRKGANELPARYARPDTSGFQVTVGDGPNELAPFVLKD